MSSKETFSANEAAEIAGITYRQIDYWIKQGYFAPDKQADGSGTRRKFNEDDLLILTLAKALVENGSQPEQVFLEIDGLKDMFLSGDNGLLVMIDGQARLVPFNEEGIEEISLNPKRNGQLTKIIKTGELRDQLAEAISQHISKQDLGR